MITVVNIKNIRGRGIEYVGRKNDYYELSGSVLSNSFKIGKDGSRTEVIKKYKSWLFAQIKKQNPEIIAELSRLKKIAIEGNLNLACWCHPEACHADVIKSCIEWAIRKSSN